MLLQESWLTGPQEMYIGKSEDEDMTVKRPNDQFVRAEGLK